MSTLLLLVRATYIYSCSSRTSRSWWITHSTQRRGCNSIFTISTLRRLNNVDSFTFHELHSYAYCHRLQHLPHLVSYFFIDFGHPKSVAKVGHNLASTCTVATIHCSFEVWTTSKAMTHKEKSCIQSKVAN